MEKRNQIPAGMYFMSVKDIQKILYKVRKSELSNEEANFFYILFADQKLLDDLLQDKATERMKNGEREKLFIRWVQSVPEAFRSDFQEQYLKMHVMWPNCNHRVRDELALIGSRHLKTRNVTFSDSFLKRVIARYNSKKPHYIRGERAMGRRAILAAGELKRASLIDNILDYAQQEHVDIWAVCISLW